MQRKRQVRFSARHDIILLREVIGQNPFASKEPGKFSTMSFFKQCEFSNNSWCEQKPIDIMWQTGIKYIQILNCTLGQS